MFRTRCSTVSWRVSSASYLLLGLLYLVALDLRVVECLDVTVNIPEGVREGEMATLSCSYSPDQGAAIYWRKDGSNILIQGAGFADGVFGDYVGRADLVGQASLRINDTKASDEGVYTCEIFAASQSAGSSGEMKIWVIHIDEPQQILNRTNGSTIEMPINDSLHIVASIENSRPAAKFIWTLNQQEVNEMYVDYTSVNYTYVNITSQSNSTLFNANSILRLPLEKDHNNDTLMCEGTHPALSTSLLWIFKLNVTYPPVVKIRITPGEVQCQVDSNPVSDLTMTIANSEPTNVVYSDNLATLQRDGEIGKLSCVANNFMGNHSAYYVLLLLFIDLGPLFAFLFLALWAFFVLIARLLVAQWPCTKNTSEDTSTGTCTYYAVRNLARFGPLVGVVLAVVVIILACVPPNSGNVDQQGFIVVVVQSAVAAVMSIVELVAGCCFRKSDTPPPTEDASGQNSSQEAHFAQVKTQKKKDKNSRMGSAPPAEGFQNHGGGNGGNLQPWKFATMVLGFVKGLMIAVAGTVLSVLRGVVVGIALGAIFIAVLVIAIMVWLIVRVCCRRNQGSRVAQDSNEARSQSMVELERQLTETDEETATSVKPQHEVKTSDKHLKSVHEKPRMLPPLQLDPLPKQKKKKKGKRKKNTTDEDKTMPEAGQKDE